MKKIFYIFLVAIAYIGISKNASAQYKSVFGDSSTEWSIITRTACKNLYSSHFFDRWEGTRKDTVINSKSYIKITEWDIDVPVKDIFFLREDTTAGKVWLYAADDSAEYLVMDLSLNVNDTFKISGYKDTLTFIADSVFYVNDLKHIRLTGQHTFCNKINEQLTFIEGTGTTAGLFYRWLQDEDSVNSYLLCHKKDGIKIQDNNYLPGKCLILSINEGNNSFTYFNIYPNPIKNTGTISFSNDERSNINFSIYDVSGKCLYQTQCRENQFQFTTENLKAGVYIYKLQGENGRSASGKLIKQ